MTKVFSNVVKHISNKVLLEPPRLSQGGGPRARTHAPTARCVSAAAAPASASPYAYGRDRRARSRREWRACVAGPDLGSVPYAPAMRADVGTPRHTDATNLEIRPR